MSYHEAERHRSRTRSAVIAAVLITFTATMVGIVGVVLAGFAAYFAYEEYSAPDYAESYPPYEGDPYHVRMTHPERVTVGETFDLVLTIDQALSRSRTLGAVEVWNRFLDGFAFVGADPPCEFTSNKQLGWDYASCWFHDGLRFDDTLELRITLEAKEPGRYGGRVDVSDTKEYYTTVYALIDVDEPSKPEALDEAGIGTGRVK